MSQPIASGNFVMPVDLRDLERDDKTLSYTVSESSKHFNKSNFQKVYKMFQKDLNEGRDYQVINNPKYFDVFYYLIRKQANSKKISETCSNLVDEMCDWLEVLEKRGKIKEQVSFSCASRSNLLGRRVL